MSPQPSDSGGPQRQSPGDSLAERITTFIWTGLGALVSFGGYSLWHLHAFAAELEQRCRINTEHVAEVRKELRGMPDGTELRRIDPRMDALEQWRSVSESRLERVESELYVLHHPTKK